MAKLLVLRIGKYKYFHKVRRLQSTTALLDLGFSLVPIPVESGLKEGSKLSCAFWNLLAGEVVAKLDAKHSLGLDGRTRLGPVKRVIA